MTAPSPGATRPPDRPLLTPAEVAIRFRVDPKTVLRWGRQGRLADLLPAAVTAWAGLSDSNPPVMVVIEEDEGPVLMDLASLNDDYEWDFDRIADAIEGTP